MNKNCYRIIFNKARGLLMAVAETTSGQVKSSGATSVSSSSNHSSLIAAINPLAFFVWILFGLVITPAAHAQIVADPGVAANQRATVLVAPNNVTLVNIQTPSAAGVSRNKYSQFDVQQQGAILNNSRTNVKTELGGWVQGNPWLATGSARVILNEINSNNPSLLKGYVEVAGQRAQVVIANPSGITCDGCGFVNANRATITTGTPIMNSGNLEGFRVQGGMVTINGNGIDASTTDYTDIIARAVQINAGIWANQIKVVTGTNQVSIDQASNEPGVSGTTAGTGAAPKFAIDTAQLGGMYAGKITLLATEAGVGVRNAGKLYAGVGDVIITANGQLQNAGQITSSGQAQIDTQNGVQNTGTVYAQGNTTITTRGDINNSGANAVIAAQNHTALGATGVGSQITSTTGSVLAAGVQTDGTLGTSGKLTASATQSIVARGQNLSGGDQSLTAQAVDLSGSQTSARHLYVTASSGDINLANATLAASQTLTTFAAQTLRTDRSQVSANHINASAHNLSNVQGQIVQTGSGDMALNLPGNLDNTEGRIASNSANVSIGADTLGNTGGTLEHAGTGTLSINANMLNGTRGTIAINGALNLTATNATLSAATTTAQQLNINSATLSHHGSTMTQTGGGAATISASNILDNTGGTIASNGAATLTVATLKNRGGTIQAAGSAASDLTLTATADIDNSNAGRISASGNATIAGDSLDNTRGQITAGQALTARTTQATNNSQGLLAANGPVTLTASQFNNQAGTIGSIQDAVSIAAQTAALNNQAGRIEADKTTAISAIGITNTDGTITGNSLSANSQRQSFNNTRGKLIASGTAGTDTLNVQSGGLTNDSGLIQGASALTVNTHGQLLTNTNSGTSGGIVGQSTINLSTSDLNNQAGYVGSNAALTIDGATITNTQGGNIVSSAAATINANSLNNQGGQIQAVGNVDATLSGGLNNTDSLMRSGQNLTINAASVNNANTTGLNQGLEGYNVALSASSLDNTAGAIRANNNTIVTSSGTVNNTNGLVSAGNTLTVQDTAANKTLVITNTNAALIAGQQITIDSASLNGDGKVLSQGNLNVKLKQSVTNTGQIVANGNATIEIDATLTNQGTLAAGNTFNAKAATIDNQAGGTISASNIKLHATDSHTLTNRGTINGTETVLETRSLNNLGTGKIYGDHVAIGATMVTNAAENGIAPVIAARDRLDIGAETINNSEHAILFSGGDVAIGGSLDVSKRATGQATTLNNDSATIEAIGSADINAKTVNNTNQNFSITTENLPAQTIAEYQGSGSPNRYAPGTPEVYVYNDESDHLHTPEGNYERWSAYNYTRNTSETRVGSSDPAQITSGGALRITSDTVNNDKSHIIAGGTLTGTIGNLNNTEVAGERVIIDAGSVTSYWRNHRKGRDSTGSSSADYNPAPTIQAISLTPTVYQQNTASSGSGTRVAALSTASVNQNPGAASSATGSTRGGQVITPITQVVAANSSSASGPATVVRSGGINISMPNNSLFGITPNRTAHYLIETDPAFANYRAWLSSDYLLNALSIDPALTQKRLGDGFYEQKLIREQVAQLTGRRFLDGYANDEAQYAALMNSGVTFAQAYNLVPGVSLSAAQMAQLTNDIVWLVEKEITLANGTTTKALVPQLYVHAQEGDLQAGGALIAGNNVNLNLTGNLFNGGTIAGRQVVALTAENINNLGGRIFGSDIGVAARTDLNNLGGTIAANNNLVASAGRDLNVTSTTRTQNNVQGSQTNIERVAGLYVTGSTGTLLASAGRDANLIAAVIQNQGSGDTTITANNNVNLATITQSSSNRIFWNGNNNRSDSSSVDVGTSVQSQGNLTLQAGNDLNAMGANVTSTLGDLTAMAVNNINLSAGEANVRVDEAHQHKGRSSALSSKTITTRDTLDQTSAQATTLSGNTTMVLAGRDINLTGSNVVSDNGTTLAAQNNLNIAAATNTLVEGHFRDEKKSGIFSGGGLSLTIGTQQQSTDQKGVTKTAVASMVGSTQGDINLQAGKNYAQTGSDVVAPQGDINIGAQRVDINEARETSNNQIESKFKQSGLTVAITSPIITAVQTAQQMRRAAGDTKHPRMQVLAAASTALSAKNAVDATAAEQIGGVNLSISIGSSKSSSKTTQISDSAVGSNLISGQDIRITARGAGRDSDLTVQGSHLAAVNNLTLQADDEIRLLAAVNTAAQHSTSKNSSASVGFSIGTDGLLFNVGASGGRGKADGADMSWSNSHVEAGQRLTLDAGGDTTLRGAVASGQQVIAKVGTAGQGKLLIESLQDTSSYNSKQQSAGFSLSVGYGKMSGSVSASQSKVKSEYASVAEESGLQAGDRGFQVEVKGDTNLKGAVIASTQSAVDNENNTFTTGGTQTLSDLQNRASYSAKSVSVNLGSGVSFDGKLIPGGTSAGLGQDSGKAGSTTLAGISGMAGNTAVRSGDRETGIQKIYDQQQVQKEIEAQVKITQQFGQLAPKAAADFATSQSKALKDQAGQESEAVKRSALYAEARLWDEGGAYRVALHAAIGGLAGGASGALGAGAVASAAPLINELQDSVTRALMAAGASDAVARAAGQLVALGTATGLGAAVSGGTTAGAVSGLNVDANNRQLHITEKAILAAVAKALTAKATAEHELTPEQLKQFENYWFDQLSAEARASVDPITAKNREEFLNQVAATNQPGYAGLQGAGNYLSDAQTARAVVASLAGKPILGTDGKPIIADGGVLLTFQATTAQYIDSKLFFANDTATLVRQYGSIEAANAASIGASRSANINDVIGGNYRNSELLAAYRVPSEGLGLNTTDLDLATLGLAGLIKSGVKSALEIASSAVERRLAQAAVSAGASIATAEQIAIRQRVLGNVAESQSARASSGFDVHVARTDQIRWGYAADQWSMTTLPAGSRVYGGIPGQSAYYTTEGALTSAGLGRESLFQSLQVTPHPVFGFRPQMGVYEVTSDLSIPSGIVRANPTFGSGGATQYFIRDYNNQLRLLNTINLGP